LSLQSVQSLHSFSSCSAESQAEFKETLLESEERLKLERLSLRMRERLVANGRGIPSPSASSMHARFLNGNPMRRREDVDSYWPNQLAQSASPVSDYPQR